MASIHADLYARSLADPDSFWAAAAEDIYWDRRWDRVLDRSRAPFYHWFAGGRLNTCYNALDVHVDRGRGKQLALIYDTPVTGIVRTFTYQELRDEVARFAGALRRQGIDKGDRVIIYMPMVPEAIIAMLACARIGAIHSVVFGGFAANELAKRIDDARPRLILSASCGIEVNRVIPYKPLLDGAIEIADAQARALRDPAAASGAGAADRRGATSTGATSWRARRRPSACRSPPPIRSTSCTRRAPPASRRASCATTAATRSRSSGA